MDPFGGKIHWLFAASGYTASMRWLYWILGVLGSASIFCVVVFGCEETLEVCSPCGSIEDGDGTIAHEPRLDLSFSALQQIRRETRRIQERFERTIAVLESGLDVPKADLAAKIEDVIGQGTVYVTFPECRMSRMAVVEAQHRCEDALCPGINRSKTSVYCDGILDGACDASSDKGCFVSSRDVECEGASCLGTCEDLLTGVCPGVCRGICENGPCDWQDNQGKCDGRCLGVCTGVCHSETPFACNGSCLGDCEQPVDTSCPSRFFGYCDGASTMGTCLGNIYPLGCSESCSSCDDNTCEACEEETIAVCRESAKFVGWSTLQCHDGKVGIYRGTESSVMAHEKAVIEAGLSVLLNDYSWLRLVLGGEVLSADGGDVILGNHSQRVEFDDLSYRFEGSAMPSELRVDSDRLAYPLESLKAHFYWFKNNVLSSTDGYGIPFGSFKCVSGALDDALAVLEEMAPVLEKNRQDESVYFVADTDCEPSVEPAWPTCLYALLAKHHQLLKFLVEQSK